MNIINPTPPSKKYKDAKYSVLPFEGGMKPGDMYLIDDEFFTYEEVADKAEEYGLSIKEYESSLKNRIEKVPASSIHELEGVTLTANTPKELKPFQKEAKNITKTLSKLQTPQEKKDYLNVRLRDFSDNDQEKIKKFIKPLDEFKTVKEEINYYDAQINDYNSFLEKNYSVFKTDKYKTFEEGLISINKELEDAVKNEELELEEVVKVKMNNYLWKNRETVAEVNNAITNIDAVSKEYENIANAYLKAINSDENLAETMLDKHYDISERLSVAAYDIFSSIGSLLTFDKEIQAAEGKKIAERRNRLAENLNFDLASEEGKLGRLFLENVSDQASSSLGMALGLALAPVTGGASLAVSAGIFGTMQAGRTSRDLFYQVSQAEEKIKNLQDQLKTEKNPDTVKSIQDQINKINNTEIFSDSRIALTALTSGAIEGGFTYGFGKLGLAAAKNLGKFLGPKINSFLQYTKPGAIISTTAASLGEFPEEYSIEIADRVQRGFLLGEDIDLSDIATKDFAFQVASGTVGGTSITASLSTTAYISNAGKTVQQKLQSNKINKTLEKLRQQYNSIALKPEDQITDFERQELQRIQNAANTLIQERAELESIGVINLTKLTSNQLKNVLSNQSKADKIVKTFKKEAQKHLESGGKLEDENFKFRANQLQQEYNNYLKESTDILSSSNIENDIEEQNKKKLSFNQQLLFKEYNKNKKIAQTKNKNIFELSATNKKIKDLVINIEAGLYEIKDQDVNNILNALQQNENFNNWYNALSEQEKTNYTSDLKNNAIDILSGNGYYDRKNNVRYLNELNIANSILNEKGSNVDRVISTQTPLHETLHDFSYTVGLETVQNVSIELEEQLKQKFDNKKITEEDYKAIQERINTYKSKTSEKDFTEELMTLYYELNNSGIINDSEIDNNLSLKRFITKARRAVYGDIGTFNNIKSASDAKLFLTSFNNDLKAKGKYAARVSVTDEERDGLLSESSQQKLNDRIDNLVGQKDEEGNYQWASKEEFQVSPEFINVFESIDAGILDPLILRGIEGKSVYGKPLETFLEDVKLELTGTLMRFDPTKNNSLIGFINKQLSFRKGDVLNRYKKEFGDQGTISIDVEAGEVGSVRELMAEEVDFDETIDLNVSEEKFVDKRINPAEILGEQAINDVIEIVKEEINTIDVKKLNFKKIPNLVAKTIQAVTGVPADKIIDPKKNLSSSEFNAGRSFLYENVEKVIKILPQGAVTEAASESLIGTSTGLAKNLLNNFYRKNPKRRTEAQGLFEFELLPDITKKDFLDAIGVNEDGSFKTGITARNQEGQTVKQLLNLLGKLSTNTAIRKSLEDLDYDPNIIQDIRAGSNDNMLSLNVQQAEDIDSDKIYQGLKDNLFKDTGSLSSKNIGLRVERKFGLAKGGYEKIISRVLTSSNRGVQEYYLNNIKDFNEIQEDFIYFLPDIIRKTRVLAKGVIKAHYRNNAHGFNFETYDAETSKKKFYENGKLVKNTSYLQSILTTSESVNKMLDSGIKSRYKYSDKLQEKINNLEEIKVRFKPEILHSANVSVANQKNKTSFLNYIKQRAEKNKERKLLREIVYLLKKEYLEQVVKEGDKTKIEKAISFMVNSSLASANVTTGERALGTIIQSASYFDTSFKKEYRIEHLDNSVKFETRLLQHLLIDSKPFLSSYVAVVPVEYSKTLDREGFKYANKNQTVDALKQIHDVYQKEGLESISSSEIDVKNLEDKMAGIIANLDSRITAGQTLDLATAKNLAATRRKRRDIIAPSADDFDGLIYRLLAKGKLGEEQYEFFKENLYKPFGEAYYRLNIARSKVETDFKNINKSSKEVIKKLKQDSGFGGYTFEQALRVWLFNKAGFTPSGLNEDTVKLLVRVVKSNKDIQAYGEKIAEILPIEEYWVEPDPNNWQIDGIKTDVINAIEKVTRKRFLSEWKENKDQIFSENNMNKLRAALGEDYVEALKDILYRMETGSSRPEGSNKQMNSFMNWVRGSVATTMFLNRRTAILQQISNVNFLNWGDNNPLKAAAALADVNQYTKDVSFLFNSPYLKQRRGGLKTDVNAADLADAMRKGGYKGMLARLLQFGFSLTQLGDSFAIATGGATLYRNRINTYLKQGKTKEQAEKQAFLDFQEISEETQQSARPDRLSQQQTTMIGRVFLAFQNTPMQVTRLQVKALKDLIAGRGDRKTNVSKFIYYSTVQSIIFSALQTALIGDLFDLEEVDEEDIDRKIVRVSNNVIDTFLKGTGLYGVFVSTAKNVALRWYEEEVVKPKAGKRGDKGLVIVEALNVSPPIGIKARKFYGSLVNYGYNKDVVKEIGFDIDNPIVDVGTGFVESAFNLPIQNQLNVYRNIRAATDNEIETWQRIALLLGWNTWDLGIEEDDIKNQIKNIREVRAGYRAQGRKNTKTIRR